MATTKYYTFDEYSGGGSLLNKHTTPSNLYSECKDCGLSFQQIEEVCDLIANNAEVIIQNGEIKAVEYKLNKR